MRPVRNHAMKSLPPPQPVSAQCAPFLSPAQGDTGIPVLARLRAVGLRRTIARICILQVVQRAGPHGMEAEEVFLQTGWRGTQVSASTVRRTLRLCVVLGLLQQHRNHRSSLRYSMHEPADQSADIPPRPSY